MSSKKQGFEYEAMVGTEAVVEHLEAILSGLKAGAIKLESGEARACVTPTEITKLQIETKESVDAQTLKIKMKWKQVSAAPTAMDSALTISAGDPEGAGEE